MPAAFAFAFDFGMAPGYSASGSLWYQPRTARKSAQPCSVTGGAGFSTVWSGARPSCETHEPLPDTHYISILFEKKNNNHLTIAGPETAYLTGEPEAKDAQAHADTY